MAVLEHYCGIIRYMWFSTFVYFTLALIRYDRMMRVRHAVSDLVSKPSNSRCGPNYLHLSENSFILFFIIFIIFNDFSLIFFDFTFIMWWTFTYCESNHVDFGVWIQLLPTSFLSFNFKSWFLLIWKFLVMISL